MTLTKLAKLGIGVKTSTYYLLIYTMLADDKEVLTVAVFGMN